MEKRGVIAFIINSLAGGGAERVFCNVVEGLSSHAGKDWDVEIILLDDEAQAYAPPAYAPVRTLAAQRGFGKSIARLTEALRRKKPALALSFLSRSNCANIIASRVVGHKTIISERVNTSAHFGAGLRAAPLRLMTRMLYPQANAILAVSDGVKFGLVDHFAVPAAKIETIHNPVDIAAIQEAAKAEPEFVCEAPYIVGVGRLTANKNFSLLIEAFTRSGLPHRLVILGEGEERAALQEQARASGVADRVFLPGYLRNPFAVIARSAMFVSSSNAEGFPNGLVEAMALGAPVAATNCPSGPAEILAGDARIVVTGAHDADYGVLSPTGNARALAQAMQILVKRRDHFSARAKARAADFAPARIHAAYWSAITRVADAR